MTLVELCEKNQLTENIKAVSKTEGVTPEFLAKGIAAGTIVIPANRNRKFRNPAGVGTGLRTKVNANIGTSPDSCSLEEEREKLRACVLAGADAVMDLSTGGDLAAIRAMVLKESPLCVGTVPIYQCACETVARGRKITQMDAERMFGVIEQQAEEGVDFMTVHCGINLETAAMLERSGRLAGVVSRGGSFLVKWIKANGKENPLFEQYDRLLEIAKKHDVTLSLGDGLRPGCIMDANDAAQIGELSVLGDLVLRARRAGVQVMIEGPGHMPLDEITGHVQLAKKLGHGAPLYLLGPLVTDIAAGYDHITSAIGGAVAASAGVDFLCYVTPAEHIRLPNAQDVYEGTMASRIAAHAADIVKNVPGARERDAAMSRWRKARDWARQEELSLDPKKFASERKKLPPREEDVCTMCGEFCAMRDE